MTDYDALLKRLDARENGVRISLEAATAIRDLRLQVAEANERLKSFEHPVASTGYASPRETWPEDETIEEIIAESEGFVDAVFDLAEKFDVPVTNKLRAVAERTVPTPCRNVVEAERDEARTRAAEAEAVIERAKVIADGRGTLGSIIREVRLVLDSAPSAALNDRLAQAWDEGAIWGAGEVDANFIDHPLKLAPSDNPYRKEAGE